MTKLLQTLASLKLAVGILVLLLIALAAGTIVESSSGAFSTTFSICILSGVAPRPPPVSMRKGIRSPSTVR